MKLNMESQRMELQKAAAAHVGHCRYENNYDRIIKICGVAGCGKTDTPPAESEDAAETTTATASLFSLIPTGIILGILNSKYDLYRIIGMDLKTIIFSFIALFLIMIMLYAFILLALVC